MWLGYVSKYMHLSNDYNFEMVKKTMEQCVYPSLVKTSKIIITSNNKMSQGGFNTNVLIVIYINKTWEPCHVTINIFEFHKSLRVTMAIQVKDLLAQYGLCDKVIMYM